MQQTTSPQILRIYQWQTETLRNSRFISAYQGQFVVTIQNFPGAVSLGPIMVINQYASDVLIKHEWGHFRQFQELGVLMYFVGVGIPSIINAHSGVVHGLGESITFGWNICFNFLWQPDYSYLSWTVHLALRFAATAPSHNEFFCNYRLNERLLNAECVKVL